MAAHLLLTLDTQIPVAHWDTPRIQARTLLAPFTLSEPSASRAELVRRSGETLPLSVSPNLVSGEIPAGVGADAEVRLYVQDEVGNEGIAVLSLGGAMHDLVRLMVKVMRAGWLRVTHARR